MDYDRPFSNLKVLDVSQGVAGPYCGALLALYGAQVIKLEPPDGDWVRRLGGRYADHSVLGICSNRGKRSIALDLKSDSGRGVALQLAKSADVVIEGFRPGVAERLGVGYTTVRELNPRVLYVSVSGYGQTSPYRNRPCTDTVVQAFSGLMSINRGRDGAPHRVRFLIADMVTGVYAFQALTPALYAREHLAEGRHIDVSLTQSAAAIQAARISEHALEAGHPKLLNAPAGTYRTSDGWIAITLVTEAHFGAMCEALELTRLLDDERFVDFEARGVHVEVLMETIQERLLTATSDDWCARFERAGGLAQRIYDYGDWLRDPHVQETEAAPVMHQPGVGDLPMPRVPGMLPIDRDDSRQRAPSVGEHGRQILEEYGYASSEIDKLIRAGILRISTQAR